MGAEQSYMDRCVMPRVREPAAVRGHVRHDAVIEQQFGNRPQISMTMCKDDCGKTIA